MESPGFASATSVLEVALALLVSVPLVILAYRGMQRPRLRLVPANDGWRTTRRDTVQYALSIVPLLLLWWGLLMVVLFITANPLDAVGVLTVAGGVVLAVRVLAHVRTEWAHELAKAVPLTLIVVGLITRSIRAPRDLIRVGTEFEQLTVSAAAIGLVVMIEFAATAAWYFLGVRRLGKRGWAVPGVPDGVRTPS
jgi:hypothetical protein